MPLPKWNKRGYLIPGRHTASVADIYERCVADAPAEHRSQREILFGAFQSYTGMIKPILGAGSLLVGGQFVSRESDPPDDIDVVVIPEDWNRVAMLPVHRQEQLHQLLTLHDVIVGHPLTMYMSSIKPVGSVIDAYLCYPGQRDIWEAQLSEIFDEFQRPVPGTAKGYVEVIL